ncbi:MAG: DEAD/DEAH box helicase family protein, partial [Candidatus Poribacteria bacterium]|nr:DEAD/DEAH box helicase family protein [Candidatus Poribacteria bacterium]
PESNYHPKIWLLDDGSYQVLARGSGNATGRGIAEGVEHIDVDVSWLPSSQERVNKGIEVLNAWSQGKSLGIAEVVDLPEALKRNIIATAPDQPPKPLQYEVIVNRSRGIREPRLNSISQLQIPHHLQWKQGQYAHQGEAVEAWEKAATPETGVIAMATGAGKTLTALICATRSQDRLQCKSFLIVISAPSTPLVLQWREEVKKFGVTPVAPSLESNTDQALTHLFRGLQGGGTHVVIVTNNLLCTKRFQTTVASKLNAHRDGVATMLIADEAHTLGAESFIANKPDFIQKRLALSATPERQYDPDGTEEIFDFFGPEVYEFGLERAIGFCLVPYNYYVHASTLNGEELEEFERLTRLIGVAMGSGESENESRLQGLLIARRRIIETAQSKIELLREVLVRRGPGNLSHALIYASAKNPKQFEQIGELLTSLNVKWAPVTQETTREPRKLKRILDSFAKGAGQVLLAKKVLDEGVDIPSIREAFIVASSTVEREWVQRRGRVLRLHPGKPWAIVHDFLALPPARLTQSQGSQGLRKIIGTELNRAYAFGGHARNVAGADGLHADLERISNAYWPKASSESGIMNKAGEFVIASAIPRGKPW